VTPDAWLQRHSYLRSVADWSSQVDAAATKLRAPEPELPVWDDYAGDYLEGIPLLQSASAPVEFEPVGVLTVSLVGSLATAAVAGKPGEEIQSLDRQLRREANAESRVTGWLLGDDSWTPSSPGLLRYLGWAAAARYLRPILAAFAVWRDEERWLRGYCPTCGAAPAMAQLAGKDPGRKRMLSCGRCRTRWQFSRTACPFCEADAQRLATLAIEGEGGLRIDHCESCLGYLKTYDGEGNESLLLSDWSSLHLDVLARDRGWKPAAASLFDLSFEKAEA
jgi:FdhE protein